MKNTITPKQYADEKNAIKNIVREVVGVSTPDNLSTLEYVKYLRDYLENIIALTPGHVYWLDRNNIFLGCNNEQAKNAKLKSRKEIVGKTNHDMPWKEQANEINKINLKVMETGESFTVEEYAVMANGPGIYLSQKAPLRDAKNNIIGILGVSFDITESKKLETERLNLALKASDMSTWTWNIIENIFIHDYTHNGDPFRFIGTLEDAIARIYPDDQKTVRETMLQAAENHTHLDVEYRLPCSDHDFHYVAMRGKNLKNAPEMIGVCWDITKRKRAEQKIQQQQVKIANITRLNAMGELASTLAHELNQPLAAIANFIRGCLIRLEKNNYQLDELQKVMQLTYDQAIRAGEIIHRMNQLIRKGGLYYELTHVNEIIKEIIPIVQYNFTHLTVKIHLKLANDLPTQKLDKIQIGQVILNLIRNAIEAMQIANLQNPEIQIHTTLIDTQHTAIDIIDNGPGLPEEISTEFFKPHVTTKKTGMGMGLAICRTVLEAHKGKLNLLSHSNKGAWFRIILPLQKSL